MYFEYWHTTRLGTVYLLKVIPLRQIIKFLQVLPRSQRYTNYVKLLTC